MDAKAFIINMLFSSMPFYNTLSSVLPHITLIIIDEMQLREPLIKYIGSALNYARMKKEMAIKARIRRELEY